MVEGMPLGSLRDFPYRQSDLGLDSGDTVLLMSDGFPERLNRDDEMLGNDQVREASRGSPPPDPRPSSTAWSPTAKPGPAASRRRTT